MFSKLFSLAPIAIAIFGQGFAALAQTAYPLYLVKYYNVSSNTEVHAVSGSSSYTTFTIHSVTAEPASDAVTGTWTIENGNAYLIKNQAPTGTNSIEVHRLTKASNYAVWDIHSGSGFSITDGDNGVWTIDGGDLYFIKTKNTPGMIEVHRGNHNLGFAIDVHQATAFTLADGDSATVTIRNGDLYLIKTCNTTSGQVEVYIATAASKYLAITRYVTVFSLDVASTGYWEINDAGDLYLVKTQDVVSIEVHLAKKANGYQNHDGDYASGFPNADAAHGTWVIEPVAQ